MSKCKKRGGQVTRMKLIEWIKPDKRKPVEKTKKNAKKLIETKDKKRNKEGEILKKLKQKRKVKKELQEDMKEQRKKPKMLKQTSDILPFVQIHDDYILLKEGVMDIFQVQTKNIHALND